MSVKQTKVVRVVVPVSVPVDNHGSVQQCESVRLSSPVEVNVVDQVIEHEMTGSVTVTQTGVVDPHDFCNKVLSVVAAEEVRVEAVEVKVVSHDRLKLEQVYARLISVGETTVPEGSI